MSHTLSSPVPSTVPGFRATGGACGIKRRGDEDLALVVSDRPAVAAGLFTINRIQAAPVIYDRAILERPGDTRVRAVVANSGCANACTGVEGLEDAWQTAARAAHTLGCRPDEVLVLSTGVIGERLPMDRLLPGIDARAAELSPSGWGDAARAIMTTDTRPKLAARSVGRATILGIAKGSGMISPRMATMLAVIATDLALDPGQAAEALRRAADESFHRIVVDGDMSTNDTVLLLANGASASTPRPVSEIETALTEVCRDLARAIVADGEGASKVVRIAVTGAADVQGADAVARAIAVSPLVKTAFNAEDPNWGRILSAAGAAGVPFDPSRLRLAFGPDGDDPDAEDVVEIAAGGRALPFSEAAARAIMERPAWTLHLDLGDGAAAAWLWTCDLSTDYVTINGGYRT